MNRNSKLPEFILDKNCPHILKREFISGMFGGDGIAPNYCEKTGKYGNISFCKSKNFTSKHTNITQKIRNPFNL